MNLDQKLQASLHQLVMAAEKLRESALSLSDAFSDQSKSFPYRSAVKEQDAEANSGFQTATAQEADQVGSTQEAERYFVHSGAVQQILRDATSEEILQLWHLWRGHTICTVTDLYAVINSFLATRRAS